jgi:hypothetical protein
MFTRTLLRRMAGVAAFAVAGVVLAVPSPALAVPNPIVWLRNTNSGYNARVLTNLAYQQVTQSSSTSPTSVHWEKILVNGGAALQFKNTYSNLCLDIGGDKLSGAPAIQMACNVYDPTQWWYFIPRAGGGYYALNYFTSFYLAVENSSTVSGARLVQVRYTGALSQVWEIPQV